MFKDILALIQVLAVIILLQGRKEQDHKNRLKHHNKTQDKQRDTENGESSSPTSAIAAKIHADPIKTSFDPGQNVTLTCHIQHGGPADVIHWFKDDQPINIQKDSNSSQWGEISLINITRHDAGKYNCTVWKREVFDSDLFDLHVNGAPVMTSLPEEVFASKGGDKLIICEADGWPKPAINWSREDYDLTDDNGYEIRVHPTLNQVTLVIKSVKQEHEDEYICEASNAFGKVEQYVWVAVQDNKQHVVRRPEILVKSHYVIASKGSNVTLKCEAITNIFMAVCVWKINGTKFRFNQVPCHPLQCCVQLPDRLTMAMDIYNVSQRNAGLYQCGVSALRGDHWNATTLIVGEKDTLQNISTNWKTVQARVDTQVQLTCVTSHPAFLELETFWMFQSMILNDTDPRHKIDTYKLNISDNTRTVQMSLWISNLSFSDFGNYSCVVNTSLGSSSDTVFLVQLKREKEFEANGEENSTVLIIIFPLLAGGLFLAVAFMIFLRRIHRKRLDLKIQEKAADGEFKYDLFVTFSSKDRQWVTNKLTPLLERQQLKYCIHSRDFELGRALVDNMAESVYSSRKVLAVMSKNYLESKFCRGELEMALYRSKVGRDGSLLVVTIDGMKKKKLPKALRESTFVDYHSDTGRQSWEKKLMRFLVQAPDDNANGFNTKL